MPSAPFQRDAWRLQGVDKELARQAGCKKIEPCKPEVANRHTGFLVGGTSPFGTKKAMPVYIEQKHPRPGADLHQRGSARLSGRPPSARHRPLPETQAGDRGTALADIKYSNQINCIN